MSIAEGALPFWEPKAQEFPRSYFTNGEIGQSTPRNECRSLKARFHSGSRGHGIFPAFIPEAKKLANQFPGMDVDRASGSRKHRNFPDLISETGK